VTREVERKVQDYNWHGYSYTKQVKNKITIACCPDCGVDFHKMHHLHAYKHASISNEIEKFNFETFC
jgi:hypothetical protein